MKQCIGFTAVSTLDFNKAEGNDHWSYRRGRQEISNELFGHDALEKQAKGKNVQAAVRFHPLLAECHRLRESSKSVARSHGDTQCIAGHVCVSASRAPAPCL